MLRRLLDVTGETAASCMRCDIGGPRHSAHCEADRLLARLDRVRR